MTWLLIALGGAVGAAARFLVDSAVTRWSGGRWPWGTLTVNITGSGALGALVGSDAGEHALALLAVGVCGAFTTASTFGWETLLLARGHRTAAATAYVGATVALSLVAFVLGRLAVA